MSTPSDLLFDQLVVANQLGVITINEFRQVYNLPPIEGGDIATIDTATGFIPVRMIDVYFRPLSS